MNKANVVVNSIQGLYDEKAAAIVCDISNRKRCFHHSFIHGSLMWQSRESHDGSFFCFYMEGEHWGKGYGGINYCEKCKLIRCIHRWESVTTYEIKHGQYYSEMHVVQKCEICQLRILAHGWSNCHPSDRAWPLMEEVAASIGKRAPWDGPCGSGWMCEFPVAVANIIDTQGEDGAREYIKSCLERGSCESAMNLVRP